MYEGSHKLIAVWEHHRNPHCDVVVRRLPGAVLLCLQVPLGRVQMWRCFKCCPLSKSHKITRVPEGDMRSLQNVAFYFENQADVLFNLCPSKAIWTLVILLHSSIRVSMSIFSAAAQGAASGVLLKHSVMILV